MRTAVLLALSLLLCLPLAAQSNGSSSDTTWSVYERSVISAPDSGESSVSITADGATMLFTRYASYGKQVPYVATRPEADSAAAWDVRRAAFADTVYNAAISPDGQTVFFRGPRRSSSEEEPFPPEIYRTERTSSGWTEPQTVPELYGCGGYMDVMRDGTVYGYCNKSGDYATGGNGIQRLRPDGRGGYRRTRLVSLNVSPPGTLTFDAIVHPDGDRMIVTRTSIPEDRQDELGPRGFYYHERTDDGWTPGLRLDLPYGWSPEVVDDHLLFVDEGDVQSIPLDEVGVVWP